MIPIVSFYTKDTPYDIEVMAMRESAIKVGLTKFYLCGIKSRGSWIANCQAKAEVLLSYTNVIHEPFLYVDADAIFKQYPTMFEHQWPYDIGFHYFKGEELLSGTIWVNPTHATKALLKSWLAINQHMPTAWDQKTLQRAAQMQSGLRILHLPPEYTWIFDLSEQQYGHKDPVIVHMQASRKYKRDIR
jgi:hypothetical protein